MLVFAYGSLIWNPGFDYEESLPALACGWRRQWCVRSTRHRGSADLPGVVLGLAPGGECVGLAYRVRDEAAERVLAYLDGREMCEPGYARRTITVTLADGDEEAVAYICPSPAEITPGELIRAFETATGASGTNADYFRMTAVSVMALPVPDGWPAPCAGVPETFSSAFRVPPTSQAAAGTMSAP